MTDSQPSPAPPQDDDVEKLNDAITFAERVGPLPRCAHGKALRDGSGELLEPTCGCRAAPPDTLEAQAQKWLEDGEYYMTAANRETWIKRLAEFTRQQNIGLMNVLKENRYVLKETREKVRTLEAALCEAKDRIETLTILADRG
jgi:hypothetical protein